MQPGEPEWLSPVEGESGEEYTLRWRVGSLAQVEGWAVEVGREEGGDVTTHRVDHNKNIHLHRYNNFMQILN